MDRNLQKVDGGGDYAREKPLAVHSLLQANKTNAGLGTGRIGHGLVCNGGWEGSGSREERLRQDDGTRLTGVFTDLCSGV